MLPLARLDRLGGFRDLRNMAEERLVGVFAVRVMPVIPMGVSVAVGVGAFRSSGGCGCDDVLHDCPFGGAAFPAPVEGVGV